jgi:hypothetical protein
MAFGVTSRAVPESIEKHCLPAYIASGKNCYTLETDERNRWGKEKEKKNLFIHKNPKAEGEEERRTYRK